MMKTLIMTAILLIGSSTASAATAKEGTSPKAKGSAAQPVLYCLSVEGTGSRIATKLCLTEQQWRDEGVEIARK